MSASHKTSIPTIPPCQHPSRPPHFRPAPVPIKPPCTDSVSFPKTHAVHVVPRAAAARIGRGRRPARVIAEFAAAQAKLPAALCALAAGGGQLPPCTLGRRGSGALAVALLSSPPPYARIRSPSSPAAAGAPAQHAAVHPTADAYNAAARPAGNGSGSRRPSRPAGARRRGPQANGRQAAGRAKSTVSGAGPARR